MTDLSLNITLNIHILPSVYKKFSVYTPDEDLRQIGKLSVAGFQSVMEEEKNSMLTFLIVIIAFSDVLLISLMFLEEDVQC